MSKESFIIFNQFTIIGLFAHWLSLRDLRKLGGAGICCDTIAERLPTTFFLGLQVPSELGKQDATLASVMLRIIKLTGPRIT